MSPPFTPPATPPAFAFMTEAEKNADSNRLLMLGKNVAEMRADFDRVSARHGEMLAELIEGKRNADRARSVVTQTAKFFLEKLGVL